MLHYNYKHYLTPNQPIFRYKNYDLGYYHRFYSLITVDFDTKKRVVNDIATETEIHDLL